MSWQFGCSPSIILNWLKFAQEKHENFYWFLTNMNANITLKVRFSQWIYLLTHSFSIKKQDNLHTLSRECGDVNLQQGWQASILLQGWMSSIN